MDPQDPAPSLSVVVPAYRIAGYLPACLDSILTDPTDALEIVVVDDASPDETGAVADAYAARDPRVRVVHLRVNVGLSRARNAGLAAARGAYVWFVDGDDWLAPGAIAAVRGSLAATAPDVLVVDHVEAFPDGRTVPGTPSGALAAVGDPGPVDTRPGLLTVAHSACTKVVRREFLQATGLRFHPGWYEDSAFNPALLLTATRIDALDRVCYYYRQRSGGAITKSASVRHFDVFGQYERMWREVRQAGERYEHFRPLLFRLMVDHLLVIVGSGHRVPPPMRRAFFQRMATTYRRWLPPEGYPVPGGMQRLKHALVRRGAYRSYVVMRLLWRAAARVSGRSARRRSAGRGGGRGLLVRAGRSGAPAAAEAGRPATAGDRPAAGAPAAGTASERSAHRSVFMAPLQATSSSSMVRTASA